MSNTKKLQERLDALVLRRDYWKGLKVALIADSTKHIMDVLKSRIQAKADEYVKLYDQADPSDSIRIAKSQEGRLLCRTLLDEFEIPVCEKMVYELDGKIKEISDEIRKTVDNKGVVGFATLTEGN